MTRTEAIKQLRDMMGDYEDPCLRKFSEAKRDVDALKMAIEALKREDTMLKEIERVVLYGERGEVNE